MSLLDSIVEIPRRVMVLFFVVDTSGSMNGTKIGTVNSAIEEVVHELEHISKENADAKIKVAALSFDNYTNWLYNQPIEAEEFVWRYLKADRGLTNLGMACDELNHKLSRNEFMKEASGSFAPVIILLSDGAATDDYKSKLENLKKNNWFRRAIKVAIAIGDDADPKVLTEFTGAKESVIPVYSANSLKKWIKFLTITSSEIGSNSSNIESEDSNNVDYFENESISTRKQNEFIREIEALKADDFEWEDFDDEEEW